ncbi:MAG: ATP-binding protein, partial [Pseudomonadota bacterium]
MGIAAPSGAGKTYSALKLAFGLGGKAGMIDTENGSGDLYAHLGDYDIIPLTAPYTADKYRAAIKAFEDAGYSTIIIDSLSHAWAGEGGLLDKHGKIADSGRGGNSFAAWRQVTPDHNALVEAMLQSDCHIIATMRSKTEYVIEEDEKGKKTPRKIGMAPVQR